MEKAILSLQESIIANLFPAFRKLASKHEYDSLDEAFELAQFTPTTQP